MFALKRNGVGCRSKVLISCVVFLFFYAVVSDAKLEINVNEHEEFSDMKTEVIEALCDNIVLHFTKHIRKDLEMNAKVDVYYDPSGPFIIPRENGKFDIFISAKPVFINKFTYQFSHEICHIMHNVELTSNISYENLWFQEALCMMASIWVLKDMGETWKTDPPYKQWMNYAEYMTSYADITLSRMDAQYSDSLKKWLSENESSLRSGFNNRHILVSQLGYKLLPLFQKTPSGWNAVRQLPVSTLKMEQYMREWHDKVDILDKDFVSSIASLMDIDVTIPFEEIVNQVENNADHTKLAVNDESSSSITPINPESEWNGYFDYIGEKYVDGQITTPSGDSFKEKDTLQHWFYSHAPAKFVYDISEINAMSFSCQVILPHPYCGGAASIEFIAKVDDIEIYTQEIYLDDSGIHIKFDMTQGEKFEIIIGDLGNKGCDHFVLGEPRVHHGTDSDKNESIDINTVITTDTDENDTDKEVEIDVCDVNQDGQIDLEDVKIVRSAMTQVLNDYNTDVNADGVTNNIDLNIVKLKAIEFIIAAAPSVVRPQSKIITTWGKIKKK